MKTKLYQKIADFIIERLKDAPNDKFFNLWFNIGFDFNSWCVEKEIYLR
jgi:hypothetical protein